MQSKLIPITAVAERTSYSRSSIYRLCDKGLFPRPVKIGPRRAGWVESEVEAYLAERIAGRCVPRTRGDPRCG